MCARDARARGLQGLGRAAAPWFCGAPRLPGVRLPRRARSACKRRAESPPARRSGVRTDSFASTRLHTPAAVRFPSILRKAAGLWGSGLSAGGSERVVPRGWSLRSEVRVARTHPGKGKGKSSPPRTPCVSLGEQPRRGVERERGVEPQPPHLMNVLWERPLFVRFRGRGGGRTQGLTVGSLDHRSACPPRQARRHAMAGLVQGGGRAPTRRGSAREPHLEPCPRVRLDPDVAAVEGAPHGRRHLLRQRLDGGVEGEGAGRVEREVRGPALLGARGRPRHVHSRATAAD